MTACSLLPGAWATSRSTGLPTTWRVARSVAASANASSVLSTSASCRCSPRRSAYVAILVVRPTTSEPAEPEMVSDLAAWIDGERAQPLDVADTLQSNRARRLSLRTTGWSALCERPRSDERCGKSRHNRLLLQQT